MRTGEWDRITSDGTLPAALRVKASEVVCKGYLLDAKTQIVDTVRFISFTIRSSDLSHKLGQAVVEFGSRAGQNILFDAHGFGWGDR